MVERANASQNASNTTKKKVVFIIKDSEISKEFLFSLCEILTCPKEYTLQIYMSESESYEGRLKAFCDQHEIDTLIFIQPSVGFCVRAIHALVSDCTDDSPPKQTCVAVPKRDRSFNKLSQLFTNAKTNANNAAELNLALDDRALESLTSIFDIDVKDNSIKLDAKGRFEAKGFQSHDIVCVPVQSITGDQSSVKKYIHTRFTTSNGGTTGCLLDHLTLLKIQTS